VFNLIRSIERAINDNADREPYLILIGDKAALIAELYMEHQQNVIEALEKLKGMVAEINDARKERAQRDMPAEVFSVYWLFKDESIGSPEDSANHMRAVLEDYPHWKSSESHERSVRQELYKVLIQSGIADETRVSSVAKRVMRVIMGDRR
jgi:type I restriction enzyme R subunit